MNSYTVALLPLAVFLLGIYALSTSRAASALSIQPRV